MAEKILNTRILLKYDTFDNWQASTGILKAGEVAVCAVAAEPTKDVNSVAAPQVLFKVGDGEHTFANLPWASGMAADVYDWAKAATKPDYNASEIKGLSDYISGEIQDTNTTYQIISGASGKAGMYQLQKKEINGGWANEGNEFGVDEDAIKALITAAQNKANSAYTLAEGKAAKTEAIGTVKAGETANKIVVKAVSGTGKDSIITINNVTDATNATNVNLTTTGTGTASIKVQAGTGTAASFTVNNVAEAGHATKATQDNSGNVITTTYATKKELQEHIANVVDYLGTITSATELATFKNKATKGDFVRIGGVNSIAIGSTTVYPGDVLIAAVDKPASIVDSTTGWDLVRGNDVGVVEVKQGNGIIVSDGKTATPTISHADTSTQASSTNSGRTYIQSVELDGYGHVTKLATATETVEDTNTAHTHKAGAKLVVSGTGGINGEVTYSHAQIAAPKEVEGGSGRKYITELISDDYGHITGYKAATETVVDHDTKNTAGATNTTDKLFIVGAKEQATNPQTYSESTAYIQAGALYSENKKVLTGHQSIKSINTNNTTAQTAGTETIAGSGTINLHKVSKTGSYTDLNDKPTIGNGTFTVQGDGTSITGAGSMTANQTGASSATLAVNDYSHILSAKNAATTVQAAGNLVNENGDTILFCCGTSKF